MKVYAKLHSGGEPFWKDLYTDLRGRADYWCVAGCRARARPYCRSSSS